MRVKRKKLQDRISSLHDGRYAYEEYAEALIKEFAHIPIDRYMENMPEYYEDLKELLGISEKEGENVTFAEAVWRALKMQHEDSKGFKNAIRAQTILTYPIQVFMKREE